MFRSGLIALCILCACLLYGAIFVNDSRARIAEAGQAVHRPSAPEVTIVPDPQPVKAPVVFLPDDRPARLPSGDTGSLIAGPPSPLPAKQIEPVAPKAPTPPPEDEVRQDEVELVFRIIKEDPDGGFVAGSGSAFRAFVRQDDAHVFLKSSLAYIEERRRDTLLQLDQRIAFVFAQAFADKDASVDAYADWFFGWGNSFKFMLQAVRGAAGGVTTLDINVVLDLAKVEMEDYMRDYYSDLVLKPELRDPRIVQGIETALAEAHQDYLRALRNIDDRLITFIADNARYVERIEPGELITIELDWDVEKWKAPTYYARDAYLAGLGSTMLMVAGQAAAPLLEEVALLALAPIIGEMVATIEFMGVGAIAGSEIPLLGNIVGAGLGLLADKLFNMFRERMTRDDFEADTLAAVDASIERWTKLVTPSAQIIVNRWFDETQALVATPNIEAKLGQ